MKRKKRFPKLMFILLVMLAIVLIWLLIMSRQNSSAPIDTKWFPLNAGAVSGPAPEAATTAPEAAQPETPAPAPAPEAATAAPEAAQPETPAPAPAPEAAQPETPAPAVSGTPVETGLVHTMCPDGWLYVPQKDVFGEKDEAGNYPLDPTQLCFGKGAASEVDIFSKLTIYAYYHDTGLTQDSIELHKMLYSNPEPFTMTINGVECQGFHAKEEDIFNQGQFYEYDLIFMPVDDSHFFHFQIMNSAPGNEDHVAKEDADAQLIMASMAID